MPQNSIDLQPDNIDNGQRLVSPSQSESMSRLPEMQLSNENLTDIWQKNKAPNNNENVLRRTEDMLHILESVSREIAQQFMTERMANFIDGDTAEQALRYLEHQVNRARAYFVTMDEEKLSTTPMEYLASLVESLPEPEDVAAKKQFHEAQNNYARDLVENLFWQQLDNPIVFTSHGCDHAINVAEYSVDIMRQNPEVLRAAMTKYGISEAEAEFLFQHVALFHDCGYPHLEGKKKSAHPIYSHDIVQKINKKGTLRHLIRSVTTNEKMAQLLEADIEHAIFYHGADKIEGEFGIEIEIGPVGFLTKDMDHVRSILEHFAEPNRLEVTRNVTAIKAISHDLREQIRALLQTLPPELLSRIGISSDHLLDEQFIPLLDEPKKGRGADLIAPGDQKVAFEYQDVDVLQHPFHLLRYADNMDATAARLSVEHRHPITRQFYTALGDGGIPSQQIKELTKLLDQYQKESASFAGQVKSEGELLLKTQGFKEVHIRQMKNIVQRYSEMEGAKSMAQPDFSTLLTKKYDEPADIVKAWRLLLFNSLDHSQVPADMLATIQKMSLEMPIPSMENWAGCESIAHIELQGSNLIVRVNKERFDELNRIKVQEFVKIAHTNEKSEISVGVGEYQIFRIEEAFRSLSFKGEQIRVTVVDNHDEQELLPTYKIAQENESIVQKLDQE